MPHPHRTKSDGAPIKANRELQAFSMEFSALDTLRTRAWMSCEFAAKHPDNAEARRVALLSCRSAQTAWKRLADRVELELGVGVAS